MFLYLEIAVVKRDKCYSCRRSDGNISIDFIFETRIGCQDFIALVKTKMVRILLTTKLQIVCQLKIMKMEFTFSKTHYFQALVVESWKSVENRQFQFCKKIFTVMKKKIDVPCSSDSHAILLFSIDSKVQNWSSRACTMHTGKNCSSKMCIAYQIWLFEVALIPNRTASFIANLSSYFFNNGNKILYCHKMLIMFFHRKHC